MRRTADPYARALLRLRAVTAAGLLVIAALVLLSWAHTSPDASGAPSQAGPAAAEDVPAPALAAGAGRPVTVSAVPAPRGPDTLTGALAVVLGSGVIVLLFVAGHRSRYGDAQAPRPVRSTPPPRHLAGRRVSVSLP